MIETIKNNAVQWVTVTVLGGLLARLACMRKKHKASERALVALLRKDLVAGYYQHKERGYITVLDLDVMEAMYTEYHSLGGNGTVTLLMEDLHELEVREH